MNATKSIGGTRPPVVAIVGHIDHGKSTLLDYIRRTNVVEGEAGGITQHLSAYEAVHKTPAGERSITFLDTPGHEAFRGMRSRGLEVADVAVLVVSSEEGAKPQTLEALKLIQDVAIPYIVAFTKIDKPGANLERAKTSMLEHNVYLEGMGGEVPHVALSSKTGEGVPELLDLILLAADLEGLSFEPEGPGEGVVIEAHVDKRRGNTATLIVERGTVRSGAYVVAADAVAPVRIMENFAGKSIKEALPGSPARIVGFSTLPAVGARFNTLESKKDAEAQAEKARQAVQAQSRERRGTTPKEAAKGDGDSAEAGEVEKTILPVIIKTDVAGTGEAVMHEIEKIPTSDTFEVRVVAQGVGTITDGDIKMLAGSRIPGLIVGFNVGVEREAKEQAERQGIALETFTIIYKLAEWLGGAIEERRPRERVEEVAGSARVIKVFSSTKQGTVLGGKVEEGVLREGEVVRIVRRDAVVGEGKIVSLQAGKSPVKKVEAGSEFGAQVKAGIEPAPGDYLRAVEVVFK